MEFSALPEVCLVFGKGSKSEKGGKSNCKNLH